VDAGTVLGGHYAPLTKPWGEGEKVDRIAKITKYIQKDEIKGQPYDTLARVVDIELRDERNDPRQKV
jgi:hypothetical protein